MFCFGCKTVICSNCDVGGGAYGHGHSPEEHIKPGDHFTW
jgi:hypothetical protein